MSTMSYYIKSSSGGKHLRKGDIIRITGSKDKFRVIWYYKDNLWNKIFHRKHIGNYKLKKQWH